MKTVVSISTVYSVWKLLYLLVLCAVNADCCVLWWQVSTCTWKPQIVTVVTVPGCTVHLWHQETRSVSASGTTCMAKVGALLSVGKVDRHVSGWQLYVLHTPPPPSPTHTHLHVQTHAHTRAHTCTVYAYRYSWTCMHTHKKRTRYSVYFCFSHYCLHASAKKFPLLVWKLSMGKPASHSDTAWFTQLERAILHLAIWLRVHVCLSLSALYQPGLHSWREQFFIWLRVHVCLSLSALYQPFSLCFAITIR